MLFGNFQQGRVIDQDDVSGAQEVTYAGSLTSRTATLGPDNRIVVS